MYGDMLLPCCTVYEGSRYAPRLDNGMFEEYLFFF